MVGQTGAVAGPPPNQPFDGLRERGYFRPRINAYDNTPFGPQCVVFPSPQPLPTGRQALPEGEGRYGLAPLQRELFPLNIERRAGTLRYRLLMTLGDC